MTGREESLFVSLVLVYLAYFMCSPLVGYARAFVAGKMGDDTPEQMGFLTLNPFEHVSRWWLFLIGFLQISSGYFPFGLSRHIPINQHNIQGENRPLKLLAAYFSDTVAALGISIISYFILIVFIGPDVLNYASHLFSLHYFSKDVSTYAIVLALLIHTCYTMAYLMAALSVIINLFHYFYALYFEDYFQDSDYADMIMLFGPLLILYLIIMPVIFSVQTFVVWIAQCLAHLVGIL